VSEVEPEFDVNERDSWVALWEWDQAVCHECGQLRSVCSDPATVWYPQRNVCYATATRQNIDRKWVNKHRDRKPDMAGYLPTDGVTLWVATEDISPEDYFLQPATKTTTRTTRSASAICHKAFSPALL
jgi:hypothetical protein